jgi:hypothetical protein
MNLSIRWFCDFDFFTRVRIRDYYVLQEYNPKICGHGRYKLRFMSHKGCIENGPSIQPEFHFTDVTTLLLVAGKADLISKITEYNE